MSDLDDNIKLFRVTVSDPVSGGRLTRKVMATSSRMAENMVPAGESDVVTVSELSGLEATFVFKSHPKLPKIKDQRNFFNGMSRAMNINPDLVRSLELTIPGIQNHYFRLSVAQIIEDLRDYGEDVQTAMGRFREILSNDKIAMLQAGAQSGELSTIFKKIALNVEKQSGVMKKVSSALVYPAIVLVMGVICVLVLSFTLFKQLKGMFAAFHAKLPLITQIFMGMTDFLAANWWWALPVIVLIPVIFFRNVNKMYRQAWAQDLVDRSRYLRTLNWKMNMASCLGGLSLMLSSNVPIQKSLELTSIITDHIKIRRFFNEIEKGILAGMTVDEAAQKNSMYLGEEALTFLSQIRLGSQTGNLEKIISKMAELYEEEVDEQVGMLSQFIEPIILAVLGGFVACVVLSVYMPMVTLYQAVL
jgi:type IV pilus assembly protein PilC